MNDEELGAIKKSIVDLFLEGAGKPLGVTSIFFQAYGQKWVYCLSNCQKLIVIQFDNEYRKCVHVRLEYTLRSGIFVDTHKKVWYNQTSLIYQRARSWREVWTSLGRTVHHRDHPWEEVPCVTWCFFAGKSFCHLKLFCRYVFKY